MSDLLQKVQDDIKSVMKSGDKLRLSTLRMLVSKLKYVMIEKNVKALDSAESMQVLQQQIKQRRESIEQFRSAGREESAVSEEAELAILQGYMPTQRSGAELEKIIREGIAATGAAGPKDMGAVMKFLTTNYQGQYDGKEASTLTRTLLA